MKAVVLVKQGDAKSAFEIKEVQKPSITEGEVLIKVEGFGLNFADVMARNGLYRAAPPLPSILGYEVVGEIVEVQGESSFLLGDRVLAFTRFGGYAEFAKADVRTVVKVRQEDDLGDLLALGTQYATAWFACKYSINVHQGNVVLVQSGAGGVGNALIQFLKKEKVKIIATAGSSEKCNYLKSIGVDLAVNYNQEDYWDKIDQFSGRHGLDVVFDAVGGKTFKNGLNRLSAGGKMVTYGAAYRTNSKAGFFANIKMLFQFGFTNPLFLMLNSRSIIGVNMLKVGDDRPDILSLCMHEVIKAYHNGELKPKVHAITDVKNISDAHNDLENRKVIGKSGLKW